MACFAANLQQSMQSNLRGAFVRTVVTRRWRASSYDGWFVATFDDVTHLTKYITPVQNN